ncbi:4-hydroxythreonine-4-phosphate dehydrogenase PdxA [Pseudoduganella namucuonensis]|uniref:4-hydroxythreonine-4-phosphate dehydrogenase n=1 Tax=Pseudoduganella namucuonensis TaxID=1035707 RepID=A0A1I7LTG1_9BURK|nr:4-hydroxythreonine-4-phosphate dehydrogenase PdxA [Pseudoduganella namucuonensis]SFV12939.1 4-hydroxythreonine-4-phosphate dehydrogenase [Pseudoduganella namucuonensis]
MTISNFQPVPAPDSGATAAEHLPLLAVTLGDPAGIGPELIARLLAEPGTLAAARILLIADRAELEHGMALAGRKVGFKLAPYLDTLDFSEGLPLLHDFRGATAGGFERRVATEKGGRYSLDTLDVALDLTRRGVTDAILFGPLNKSSLHLAGMAHSDELHWFAEKLDYHGPFCEFNVLDRLWTSRVTSHVALSRVPSMLSQEGVLEAIGLIDAQLRLSGVAEPRIAVCGLNPHNGDNGSFGREEIDIIAPAVERARAAGMLVQGPFPADTIFLKVQGECPEYDAVVTMYHDQGQIAIKLMGFSRGVTVQGGLPIPITTPAHGTAFDIAGQGIANPGATIQAFQLACRMGATRRTAR